MTLDREMLDAFLPEFLTEAARLGAAAEVGVAARAIDQLRAMAAALGAPSLVTAIVGLARNLRLAVVAEGVETAEQLEFLNTLHCDEWQGYLFSKPLPADDFAKLLAEKS